MGCACSSPPTPPPAPDPNAVSSGQTNANVNTAIASSILNHTNQVTPQGDLTYSQNGDMQTITLSDGSTMQIPSYTATQTLSPTGQNIFNATQGTQYQLAQLASAQAGRVANTLGTQLNFDGQPSMVGSLDPSKITQVPTGVNNSSMAQLPTGIDFSQINGANGQIGALPTINPNSMVQDPRGINTSFATSGIPTGINTAALGLLKTGVDTSALPSQVTGLNTSALPGMPGSPQQTNDQVSNAMYSQATSRLDPQWQQNEQQLNDQLTQQGIPVGSQAWNTAMDNFNRAKNDAYTSASNAATVSGAQVGGQDYGLALQGRQQGVTEQTTSASLANQAASLGLTEQQLNAAIASGTVSQVIGAQTANAGVANQAAQTGVSAEVANAGVANQAGQLQLAQQLAGVQAAQGNAGLALQGAGLNLQGQQLSGNQALAANQFNLQDQGQNAQIAQGAASQQTQQQMLSAQLAQAARQQGISEQQYLYNLPLNQTTALLSGSQVQGPSFVNTPQTQVQSPNVLGAYALQNQAQMQSYQAQMQNYMAGMGGMFGLAGAGLSAYLSPTSIAGAAAVGSARDIKENNEPLNRLKVLHSVNRLPVERWKYKQGMYDSGEHIGAYAEDFAREFGGDGKTIDLISMVGVLTISVQALTDKIGDLQDRLIKLEAERAE